MSFPLKVIDISKYNTVTGYLQGYQTDILSQEDKAFIKKYLLLIDDPIRAKICELAYLRYRYGKIVESNQDESTPQVNAINWTFSLRQLARTFILREHSIHHHIQKLIDAEVLEIAKKTPFHHYSLTTDAFRIIRKIKEDSSDVVLPLRHLIQVSESIGHLTILRNQLRDIETKLDEKVKYLAKARKKSFAITTFTVSNKFKTFLNEVKSLIQQTKNFRITEKNNNEITEAGLYVLPPMDDLGPYQNGKGIVGELTIDTTYTEQEYVNYYHEYLKVTDMPIRAAIVNLAEKKYYYGVLTGTHVKKDSIFIELTSEDPPASTLFSGKELTKQLDINKNRINHHLKTLVEADILQIGGSQKIGNLEKYYYCLTPAHVTYLHSKMIMGDQYKDSQYFWYLDHVNQLVGELFIVRIKIKKLLKQKNALQAYQAWLDNEVFSVQKFPTIETTRKELNTKIRQLLEKIPGIVQKTSNSDKNQFRIEIGDILFSFYSIPPLAELEPPIDDK